MDGEEVSDYYVDSFFSGESTSYFIFILIFCNGWKERGGDSPKNEATRIYNGLFSDPVCIGYFLVYIFGCFVSWLTLYF